MSVELIAGMIEGEGSTKFTDDEMRIANETNFKIYGTLKKTIFATSFGELRSLIKKIKDNPDDYLSERPQSRVCLIF